MQKVAEDLFEGEAGDIVLIGGRSRETGAIVFPYPTGADRAHYERIRLQQEGTLWSWTVQRFPPKAPFNGPATPDAFRPFAVGYVELADQIIVESRLLCDDFAELRIGMPMRITSEAYRTDASGEPVFTYAFRPIALEKDRLDED